MSFNHIRLQTEFFMKDYLKQNASWSQQSLKPNNPESSVRSVNTVNSSVQKTKGILFDVH